MKKQELFDKVATHLLTQNKRSENTDGFCLYRGKKGLKCAVGAIIPDELYIPEMEGKSAENLMSVYPKIRKLIGNSNKDLIGTLQWVHDYNPVAGWRKELEIAAGQYGLKLHSIMK